MAKAAKKAAKKVAAKATALIAKMKEQLEKAQTALSAQFYPPKEPGKENGRRVRLLNEPEQCVEVKIHDKFGTDIRQRPCLQHYDKKCPLDDDESVDTYDGYVITLWNYGRSVKSYFALKATNFSPLGDILRIYQENGTVLDRDILIYRDPDNAKMLKAAAAKTASPLTVPDKAPFTRDQVLAMLKADAFPKEKKEKVKTSDFEGGDDKKSGPKTEDFE